MDTTFKMLEELTNPKVLQPADIDLPGPPGFTSAQVQKKSKPGMPDKELDQLKVKKAWELATSPAKNVPMNLIMSYMTGNALQIIPITMTFMLLWNPLKAIFTETGPAFRGLQTPKNANELLLPKAVFILCQLANVAIGLWKLDKMGLIPNKEADWLSWHDAGHYIEKLSISLS